MSRINNPYLGAVNMKIISKLGLIFLSINLLVGWTYPQQGVNYPTSGAAKEYIEENKCTPSKLKECYAFSSSGSTKGVLMYVYEGNYGASLNPHFIAGYIEKLQEDCYANTEIGGACSYLKTQLSHIINTAQSKRGGMAVWPVWGNRADAMVQAELARFIYKQNQYHAHNSARVQIPGADSEYWKNLSERAGITFDWGFGWGGVVHYYDANRYWYVAAGRNDQLYVLNVMAKAMGYLDDMCDEHEAGNINDSRWCTRFTRGLNVLTDVGKRHVDIDDFQCPSNRDCSPNSSGISAWSYHRVATETAISDCDYHQLNASSVRNLIPRLQRDSPPRDTSNLTRFVYAWENSYQQAVSIGLCD